MKKEKVPVSSEIISNDGFLFECCCQRNKDKVDIKVIEDYLEDCALSDCYYFEQYHIYLLLEEYKDFKKKLEQKENIIKEVRELIKTRTKLIPFNENGEGGGLELIDYDIEELLKILDKENK